MTDHQINFILIAGVVFGAPIGALVAFIHDLRESRSYRMGWAWCAAMGALRGAGIGFFVAGWLCLAVYVVRELSK